MKSRTVYICQNCGSESAKWGGKCLSCGEWNSLVEETIGEKTPKSLRSSTHSSSRAGSPIAIPEISTDLDIRISTGIKELDRVLGGGIVKGSLVLVGGDPGIGKSTLLLQLCNGISKAQTVMYVTGEESLPQIKLRAERLNVLHSNIFILAETNVSDIISTVERDKPGLVIIDSIQTMFMENISSMPGSVTQVRESTAELMRMAKSHNIPVFIIGHVNKEGVLAGPKVMEHMVDTVLYFEGERNHTYRLLRTVKNRYGATNEIGVFEMTNTGLCQVDNPSKMLLSGRPNKVSGTCVACIMEGSRPILIEVQALVSKTSFGNPRRLATGLDYNRMSVLTAVLEKRSGMFMGNYDIFINVVGGIKLDEPAADLSVILALSSSVKDIPITDDIAAIGEVGLAGEIRNVTNIDLRIAELSRMGFSRCIVPGNHKINNKAFSGIEILKVNHILQAFNMIF